MSLKKKFHTDQMDWFPWRKKPNISSYFYNVYVSVFLAYFLCFSFNDWLVVVFMKILESSALHVYQYIFCLLFMLTSQFIPSKADVVYNSAYSNCCCWQLRSFHQLLTNCLFCLLLCWEFYQVHLPLLVWCWQLYPVLLLSALSSPLILPIFCTCGPQHWSLVSALCNNKNEY